MFKSKKLKSLSNTLKIVGSVDLSAGVNKKSFVLDDVSGYHVLFVYTKLLTTGQLCRFGLSGKLLAVAHNPIQSLLAVSTDTGEIHVYGQQQVEVVFSLNLGIEIQELRFVKGVYLVGLDAKGTIYVFSLHSKKILHKTLAPARVTATEADPTLDWLLLGLQNGSIVAYDIDRGNLTPFKIDNLQKKILPKENISPVVSLQWSPRDIGTILVGYSQSAVIYSITTGEIKNSFLYEVPANAPGADALALSKPRYPKLIQALYHPNSLHIVTLHNDGSIVFWDAQSGKLIHARSLMDTDINLPAPNNRSKPTRNTKFIKAAWITAKNVEDTTLLIAGGEAAHDQRVHGLTAFHFGVSPKYSLTSYEKMSQFYAHPKQKRYLALQSMSSVANFFLLAQDSPFFSGGHNPNYIIVTLESNEIEVLNYPQGLSIHSTAVLPQGLAWINPKTTVIISEPVPKKQWLGIVGRSKKSFNALKGGVLSKKKLRNTELRTALVTGHANGFVRLWDASHGELEESSPIDVNVAQALGKKYGDPGTSVSQMSFAGDASELSVATEDGEVALFQFQTNNRYDPKASSLSLDFGKLKISSSSGIIDISSRTPNVRDGFLPEIAVIGQRGKVTAIKNSNIGFVAIAYQNGELVIIDKRGPAIIYTASIIGFSTSGQSSTLVSLEFSIMTHGDDGYSSIILFAGSNSGELYTYKILPESTGRFSAQLVDVLQSNDHAIEKVLPFRLDNGLPAIANFDNFNKLADGITINGSIITSSSRDIRILQPGKHKLSHQITSANIYAIGISIVNTGNPTKLTASVIPVVLSNNIVKIYSNPELKEISTLQIPYKMDPQYGPGSSILPSGDIIIRINETVCGLASILGHGVEVHKLPSDKLYTESAVIPARPTIGTAQWMKGTTLITRDDLGELIGGPRRPAPKTQEHELAESNISYGNFQEPADEFAYDKPVRKRTSGGYDPSNYLTHSIQSGIQGVGESFNEYANSASQMLNETVVNAKKDVMKSLIKSKFGF